MENGKVAIFLQVKAINSFVISAPVAIGGNFAQNAQVVAFKSWNFKPAVAWICVEFVGFHFDLFLFGRVDSLLQYTTWFGERKWFFFIFWGKI